jgi:hypothetical protein
MSYLRSLLVGALVALTFSSAGAQTITQSTVSGNECWNAGQGPGGTSAFLCLNTARGGTANAVLSAVSGSFTIGAATGNFTNTSSPNMTQVVDGGNVLITAQPSAATITLPPNPVPDGAIIGVCNASGAAWATNVVTLAANTSQTLAVAATLTTLAAGACAREQFNFNNSTWYRVQ